MKDNRKILLDRLSEKQTTPALRQIRKLVLEASSESSAPVVQPAQELLSLWSIRLWNTTLRARLVVGLKDLVRLLIKLEPNTKIEQISVHNGLKTGIAFFDAQTRKPIGGVLSQRNEADLQQSKRNWQKASGMIIPVLSAKPSAALRHRA